MCEKNKYSIEDSLPGIGKCEVVFSQGNKRETVGEISAEFGRKILACQNLEFPLGTYNCHGFVDYIRDPNSHKPRWEEEPCVKASKVGGLPESLPDLGERDVAIYRYVDGVPALDDKGRALFDYGVAHTAAGVITHGEELIIADKRMGGHGAVGLGKAFYSYTNLFSSVWGNSLALNELKGEDITEGTKWEKSLVIPLIEHEDHPFRMKEARDYLRSIGLEEDFINRNIFFSNGLVYWRSTY